MRTVIALIAGLAMLTMSASLHADGLADRKAEATKFIKIDKMKSGHIGQPKHYVPVRPEPD